VALGDVAEVIEWTDRPSAEVDGVVASLLDDGLATRRGRRLVLGGH
jgi:hypothetical protein